MLNFSWNTDFARTKSSSIALTIHCTRRPGLESFISMMESQGKLKYSWSYTTDAKQNASGFINWIIGSRLAQSEVQSHEIPLDEPTSKVQYLVSSAFSLNESTLPSMIRSSFEANERCEESITQTLGSDETTCFTTSSAYSRFVDD